MHLHTTYRAVVNWIIERTLPTAKDQKNLHLLLIVWWNAPIGLIDAMKGSAIPIKTVGLGMIASCGILTFMAGEKGKRFLTPNTSILSHQYSWGSGGKEHELFARVKEFELSSKRMVEHYKKCTGMPEKKIREILLPAEDVWLTAEEAVKHGIADKIVTVY